MHTTRSWLIALVLGARLASAQPEYGQTRLPSTTQFYLEMQPRLSLSQEGPSFGERFRRSPVVRVLAGLAGWSPAQLRELAQLPSWNGRLIVALVREGPASPAESYYQAWQRYERVRQLAYEAEMAFHGVNQFRKYEKKFPANVADLRARGYYEGEIPEGATLELRRQGKQVTVVGRWQQDEVRWPDPAFDSEVYAPVLPGMFLALGVANSGRLNQWLQKWDPQLDEVAWEGDHWRLSLRQFQFQLYVHEDWVTLTNSPPLAAAFQSAPGTSPDRLRHNARFAAQYGRLNDPDAELWFFVDIEDLLRTSPALLGSARDRLLMRSLAGVVSSRYENGLLRVHHEAFLHWDGEQNVTLSPLSAIPLASRIPRDCEQVLWLNVSALVRLGDRLGSEIPVAGSLFQEAWAALEAGAGFPLERKSLAQGTHAYAYIEAIDTYALQLQALIQTIGPLLGAPLPEKPEPPEFPVVGVLETGSSDLALRASERLSRALGDSAATRSVENVTYRSSDDGRRAYLQLGTTQIFAQGYTSRLLPRIARAVQGVTPGLAATPAFQQFEEGRQGELLAYYHAKLDRDYSLIKWILLQLGSDFRPEAEILGRLRDAHVSAEVVPGGLRWRGEVYSDGVTPPVRKVQDE